MAGEEQNPPKKIKTKRHMFLGDSLLSNNEMKPEKKSRKYDSAIYCTCFGNYIPRMVSTRRNRTYRMDNYATTPFSLYYHCDPSALERKNDGE